MMEFGYTEQILLIAREAGICSECPELASRLQEASVHDKAQAADSSLSDEQILESYTSPAVLQHDTRGGLSLREGRRRNRDLMQSLSASHLKTFGSLIAEAGCRGPVPAADIPQGRFVGEGAEAATEEWQQLREKFSYLLKESTYACDIELRKKPKHEQGALWRLC